MKNEKIAAIIADEKMAGARMMAGDLAGVPELGATVEMAGISAIVEDVAFFPSHSAWMITFAAPQGRQEVLASKVAEMIKAGRMIVK